MKANVFSFENFKYKQFAIEFVDIFSKDGPHPAIDYAVEKGYTEEDFKEMFNLLRDEFERQGHYKVMEDSDDKNNGA